VPTTLVTTEELATHLGDPGWVIVDCRFDLKHPHAGRDAFARGHVPGARYVGLEPELSGPAGGDGGRHPLPERSAFLATLGRLGITPASQVVAYDDRAGAWASRFWWMVRHAGHAGVAVLDGGLARWTAEGRPIDTSMTPDSTEGPYPDRPAGGVRTATGDEVGTLVGRGDWRLVDARAPERFRGESEPLDKVAGHVPGAVNAFYMDNLHQDGTFRSAADLHQRWTALLGGVAPERCVCYCGSGVTACHNLLALEHAGLGGASLYVGSWSGWSSDPGRPVETGAST
jgi:thiosulfate/3-mercaptopyruvate sulfurtransferase